MPDLEQGAVAVVPVGPFLNATTLVADDGLTAGSALNISASMNGNPISFTPTTFVLNGTTGEYLMGIDAGTPSATGLLSITISPTGDLPVQLEYTVLSQAVFLAKYGSSTAADMVTPATVSTVNGPNDFVIAVANASTLVQTITTRNVVIFKGTSPRKPDKPNIATCTLVDSTHLHLTLTSAVTVAPNATEVIWIF